MGLTDAQSRISKANSEGSNIGKLLEEAEHKLGLATKNNKTLESNLAEARQSAEDEAKVTLPYLSLRALACLL